MDPVSVQAALGFLLSCIVPIVTQSHWSERTKAIIGTIVALAAGVALAYQQGQLVIPAGPEAAAVIAGDITVVLVAAAGASFMLERAGLTDYIERITTLPHIPISIQVGTPAAPAEVPAEVPAETAPAA